MLYVNVLTLFPAMFPGILGDSIPSKALDNNIWKLNVLDIRSFATDKHAKVDDVPFGGGAGMVLKADTIDKALLSLKTVGKIIYVTPRGCVYNQSIAQSIVKNSIETDNTITFVCGRYEGIDQRVVEKWSMTEISIGDFVLSGGEGAVQVIVDSMVRLLPGAVGEYLSIEEESFQNGLLEYDHYTRPQEWNEVKVPEVLISGHHQKIKEWRQKQSEIITQKRRPDLWEQYLKNN